MSFIELYEILNLDLSLQDLFKTPISWLLFILIIISIPLIFIRIEISVMISFVFIPFIGLCSVISAEKIKLDENMRKLDVILYNGELNVERIRVLNKAILVDNKSKYFHSQYENTLNSIHKSNKLIFDYKEVVNFIGFKDREYFESLEREYRLEYGLNNSIGKNKSYKKEKESKIESLKNEIERLSNELEVERSNNCFKVCQR